MTKKIVIAVTSLIATFLISTPAQAGSWCNNGSYSSNSGRGTCSHNGGVNKNLPSFSDPGSSSFNRQNGWGTSNNMNGSSKKRNRW